MEVTSPLSASGAILRCAQRPTPISARPVCWGPFNPTWLVRAPMPPSPCFQHAPE